MCTNDCSQLFWKFLFTPHASLGPKNVDFSFEASQNVNFLGDFRLLCLYTSIHQKFYSILSILQVNGNCGEALSCGIIARSAGIFENAKRICACDGVTLWDERNKPLVGPGRQNKLWRKDYTTEIEFLLTFKICMVVLHTCEVLKFEEKVQFFSQKMCGF